MCVLSMVSSRLLSARYTVAAEAQAAAAVSMTTPLSIPENNVSSRTPFKIKAHVSSLFFFFALLI